MCAVRMLLIPIMFFTLLGAGSAQAAPGKIEEVAAGTLVKVSRSGNVIRLKKGDPLESGDEVATDANTAVDIRLEDDTLIRVGLSSTYKIEEDSKINSLIHRLLTGAVRVLVPKSETKSSAIKFRLYTPEGTIGVRGTEFVVIRTDGKTQLKGLDGTVMFGPADADFSNDAIFVNVGRGFQSTVLTGAKNAGKPEKFDLRKYLQEVNGKAGAFAPLAARMAGSKTHLRAASTGSSAPVVAAAVPKKAAPTLAAVQPAKASSGARVNYQAKLLNGAFEGNLEMVKEAVEVGRADVNSVNDAGVSALQLALTEKSEKHKKVVVYLIANGCDVNVKDKLGLTPLMFVAMHKLDMEYAKALVDPGGADLRAEDKQGRMVDEIAKEAGFTELMEYLASDEVIEDNNRAIMERNERNRKKK